MKETINKTLKSLKDRNLKPYFTKNTKEARELILSLIPRDSTAGLGDSSTVRQIGIIQSLRRRGTRVINPFDPAKKIKDDNALCAGSVAAGGTLDILIPPSGLFHIQRCFALCDRRGCSYGFTRCFPPDAALLTQVNGLNGERKFLLKKKVSTD